MPTTRTRKTTQAKTAKTSPTLLVEEKQLPIASSTIPIDSISLPASQPRRYFDPDKMGQLIQSVKNHGILENLVVRPLPETENKYELVAGERRYRAAIEIGLKEVPVTIRELTAEQALALALVENLQREDLNPLEETQGIVQLLSIRLNIPDTNVPDLLHRMQNEAKGKVTQNVLGNEQGQAVIAVFEELGLLSWESFVSSRLPLLKMPLKIIEALQAGQIAYTKALLIARVKDAEARLALLDEAIASDMSISEIRERIKELQPPVNETESPQTKIQTITRSLTQSKVWENPKKWRQVQTLLKKLEALITEEPAPDIVIEPDSEQ